MPHCVTQNFTQIHVPNLESFGSIGLTETEQVKLMNRTDSKFILDFSTLNALLPKLKTDYRILEIEGKKTGQYTSVYYDTPELTMFYKHLAGHFPRFKLRKRHYSQNNLIFLEIKRKTGNGRTGKKRVQLETHAGDLHPHSKWLEEHLPFFPENLQPALVTRFIRFTLVNHRLTERVTIDFNLAFQHHPVSAPYPCPNLVIVEIKQNKLEESPFQTLLRAEGIRRTGISKYCMGHLLLNPNQPHKRYKSSILKIKHIQNGTTGGTHTL